MDEKLDRNNEQNVHRRITNLLQLVAQEIVKRLRTQQKVDAGRSSERKRDRKNSPQDIHPRLK